MLKRLGFLGQARLFKVGVATAISFDDTDKSFLLISMILLKAFKLLQNKGGTSMSTQYLNNNEKNKVKEEAFTPLHGIKLTNGLLKKCFDNNISFLQSINIDSALYHFRQRAGKDAPGEPYRGHFDDNLYGQSAAHILMGAGNALRWGEHKELRDLVSLIIDEIKDSTDPDGYLMAIDRRYFATREYPHYVRIWVTYGLYAAYLSGNKDAGILLKGWQNWFNNEFTDLPVIKYLNLAFQGNVCSPFVYNTPFGSWQDIETTQKYYEEPWRLAQFILGQEDAVQTRHQHGYEPHPHGTEIEGFEGYLDLYKATGSYYYLNAVEAFYNAYKEGFQHVGGGIVLCEFQDAKPGETWLRPPRRYSELCCTAFWMWLNQRFHRLFPEEEQYVNEIEKSLYNVAIAGQDGDVAIRYFAWLEGKRVDGLDLNRDWNPTHCCSGVAVRLFGMLPEFLYSVNESSVYFNIYGASEFVWERENNQVKISQVTDMPYDGRVDIKLICEKTEKFKVLLRIPSWVDGDIEVVAGGEKYTGIPGTYLCIEKYWDAGEHAISFDLKFKWRQTKYTGVDSVDGYERYALEYGPLLMAAVSDTEPDTEDTLDDLRALSNKVKYAKILSEKGLEEPFYGLFKLKHNPVEFKSWLTKGSNPMTFKVEGYDHLTYMPYFEVEKGQYFACYPLFYSDNV